MTLSSTSMMWRRPPNESYAKNQNAARRPNSGHPDQPHAVEYHHLGAEWSAVVAESLEAALRCPHCPRIYRRGAFYEDLHYLPFHCLCGHHIEEEDCIIMTTDLEALESALELVEHGHAWGCASETPLVKGGFVGCDCGRDSAHETILDLFKQQQEELDSAVMDCASYLKENEALDELLKQRIPVAEVREIARETAWFFWQFRSYGPQLLLHGLNAILKEHGYDA